MGSNLEKYVWSLWYTPDSFDEDQMVAIVDNKEFADRWDKKENCSVMKHIINDMDGWED